MRTFVLPASTERNFAVCGSLRICASHGRAVPPITSGHWTEKPPLERAHSCSRRWWILRAWSEGPHRARLSLCTRTMSMLLRGAAVLELEGGHSRAIEHLYASLQRARSRAGYDLPSTFGGQGLTAARCLRTEICTSGFLAPAAFRCPRLAVGSHTGYRDVDVESAMHAMAMDCNAHCPKLQRSQSERSDRAQPASVSKRTPSTTQASTAMGWHHRKALTSTASAAEFTKTATTRRTCATACPCPSPL